MDQEIPAVIDPHMSDHDLLILLNQAVKNVRDDIRTMADGTTKTVDDHEKRIRSLEQFKWMIIGALILSQALSDVIMYLLIHNK